MKEDVDLDDERAQRRQLLEARWENKCFQRGVEFPKAGDQVHLLIIRLDLAPQETDKILDAVKPGLRRLCTLFNRIDNGEKTIDQLDN